MIVELAVLGLGVGAGSFIVSLSQVSKPARGWVLGRSKPGLRHWKSWKWLFDLLGCPFCVSVWLSLAAVAIYRPEVLPYFWPVGYVTTSLAVSAVAMAGVLVIKKALGK